MFCVCCLLLFLIFLFFVISIILNANSPFVSGHLRRVSKFSCQQFAASHVYLPVSLSLCLYLYEFVYMYMCISFACVYVCVFCKLNEHTEAVVM